MGEAGKGPGQVAARRDGRASPRDLTCTAGQSPVSPRELRQHDTTHSGTFLKLTEKRIKTYIKTENTDDLPSRAHEQADDTQLRA